MLFNSIDFAIFLPIVFVLYWFATKGNLKLQNILLLLASYFFYACWDYRFLFLLIFSTTLDYYTGLKMAEADSKQRKKFWFWLSVIINLGFLGVFKYYNFFIDSFATALANVGVETNFYTLSVILPVGISFYTFHGLSYVIDIYNDRIKPIRNVVDYSVFVSFFPLLVAGPIERATHLLPQIEKPRTFNFENSVSGMRLILWGLFKKIVVGDTAAIFANQIFDNYQNESGSHLLLGAIYFTFQIYADFSGYSDIARGTARLFGIELMLNFNYPYFSRDIAEFWRKWHISLSSWFRDYLYIPLGGSKTTKPRAIFNIIIVFLVSGFWHGANWTFIVWGLLNALYFIPLFIWDSNRKNLDQVSKDSLFPSLKDFFSIILTFGLTVIAWIFFRSETVGDAFNYIREMFSGSLFSAPTKYLRYLPILFIFIVWEWIFRNKECGLDFSPQLTRRIKWSVYFILICTILYFAGEEQEFIYFQF